MRKGMLGTCKPQHSKQAGWVVGLSNPSMNPVYLPGRTQIMKTLSHTSLWACKFLASSVRYSVLAVSWWCLAHIVTSRG